MTLGETLTLEMSSTATHLRNCERCNNDHAIKNKVMEMTILIMDGTIASQHINKIGLEINDLILSNHTYMKEIDNDIYVMRYINVSRIPNA